MGQSSDAANGDAVKHNKLWLWGKKGVEKEQEDGAYSSGTITGKKLECDKFIDLMKKRLWNSDNNTAK